MTIIKALFFVLPVILSRTGYNLNIAHWSRSFAQVRTTI